MGESSDSRSKIEMKLNFSRDKLCMIVCWILPPFASSRSAYGCTYIYMPIHSLTFHRPTLLMWINPVLLMDQNRPCRD